MRRTIAAAVISITALIIPGAVIAEAHRTSQLERMEQRVEQLQDRRDVLRDRLREVRREVHAWRQAAIQGELDPVTP